MSRNLPLLRKIIKDFQTVVDKMTTPDNLKKLEEGVLHTMPVAKRRDCKVYIIPDEFTYLLGLQFPDSLGLNEKTYELMVVNVTRKKQVPANIMRRLPRDTTYQVRFPKLPKEDADNTFPVLGAF